MTLSSLCADGGAPAILVRELAQAYAQKAGDTEEPPQYIQYAAYQDQWMKGDEGQADRNFWNSQHLSSSHTELPFEALLTGRQRISASDYCGSRCAGDQQTIARF